MSINNYWNNSWEGAYYNRQLIYKYTNNPTRKEWLKNWRQEYVWKRYLDVDMFEVEKDLIAYCEKNKLEYYIVASEIYVRSNRYHFNRIYDLIDEILELREYED